MILFVIVNRTEASKVMLRNARQSNLSTARASNDGRVVLSFIDIDGIPEGFLGMTHYTQAEIIVEMAKPEWSTDV